MKCPECGTEYTHKEFCLDIAGGMPCYCDLYDPGDYIKNNGLPKVHKEV